MSSSRHGRSAAVPPAVEPDANADGTGSSGRLDDGRTRTNALGGAEFHEKGLPRALRRYRDQVRARRKVVAGPAQLVLANQQDPLVPVRGHQGDESFDDIPELQRDTSPTDRDATEAAADLRRKSKNELSVFDERVRILMCALVDQVEENEKIKKRLAVVERLLREERMK